MCLKNVHKKLQAHTITKHAKSGNGTGGMRIGASAETVLSARDTFYVENFLVTIDKTLEPLKDRATSYQSVYTIFMETFPGEIFQFVAFAKGRG